jgi:hypothetical protein
MKSLYATLRPAALELALFFAIGLLAVGLLAGSLWML